MNSAPIEDNQTTTTDTPPILRAKDAEISAPFDTDDDATTPLVSIVIPVYNEESILEESVIDLMADMERFAFSYEIVLAENGSSDRTLELGTALASQHPQIRIFQCPEPDYGLALRMGIESSRARYVICEEIDLCDTDFHERALGLLIEGESDLIVGSKALASSNDKRPLFRRTATLVINMLLRIFLGFRGTDTHGLKAFHRSRLLDVVKSCVVNRDLFASEFVIRSERGDFRVKEIPISLEEKRPPSVKLISRVPHVLANLVRLVWAIRMSRRPPGSA